MKPDPNRPQYLVNMLIATAKAEVQNKNYPLKALELKKKQEALKTELLDLLKKESK